MSVICPLTNEYGETLKWQFTQPLGTCIYNIYDQFAFIIGWLSVAAWTFALLPQIVTNCKNKGAESQSFWFWILWLVGDFCNLSGCILTKNLITNIALALVYLSLTLFACLQFIWYEYILPRYRYLKTKKEYLLHAKIKDITEQITTTKSLNLKLYQQRGLETEEEEIKGNEYQIRKKKKKLRKNKRIKRKKRNTPRPTDLVGLRHMNASSAAIWRTPQFALQYQRSVPITIMSRRLKSTLKILSRSPRMFAVSPQLTGRMKREYMRLQGISSSED